MTTPDRLLGFRGGDSAGSKLVESDLRGKQLVDDIWHPASMTNAGDILVNASSKGADVRDAMAVLTPLRRRSAFAGRTDVCPIITDSGNLYGSTLNAIADGAMRGIKSVPTMRPEA